MSQVVVRSVVGIDMDDCGVVRLWGRESHSRANRLLPSPLRGGVGGGVVRSSDPRRSIRRQQFADVVGERAGLFGGEDQRRVAELLVRDAQEVLRSLGLGAAI